jgi:hypothetical protein
MSRYTTASQRKSAPTTPKTPAVWSGIGCLLMLIVPIISWMLASITVQLAVDQGWPMPYQLMGFPVMPAWLWSVPGFAPILGFIQSQPNLYAVLGLMVTYIVILGAILAFVYSAVYRFIGPPRYGPLDMPPAKAKVGRYKR